MNVVVVESPAKAKTINKYLGPDYTVLASYGHVRDLPSKDGSVRPDDDFSMSWEPTARSEKRIEEIAKSLKQGDRLYLATDPDREGEAISWHVQELLAQRKVLEGVDVKRVVFNEITKDAVLEAMRHPRNLDKDLIEAYLARRALDYLVGFTLSPVLWRKLPGSRSAGRVQSVALRLICEREAEIEVFKPREYWSVEADFATDKGDRFAAQLTHLGGEKLDKFGLPDEAAAKAAVADIERRAFHVAKVERKQARRNPQPPFTTSTLQQEASRKLGFSASHTMRVAQRLYEGVDVGGETVGLITYMRTDSVNLAKEAMSAIRGMIGREYGNDYLPDAPRTYKTKAKAAQEAHEAIRPTDVTRRARDLPASLDGDQVKLYRLIWQRAVASQMASAVLDQVAVDVASEDRMVTLRATGSVVVFPGFFRLYHEDRDDAAAETDETKDRLLPAVVEGQAVQRGEIRPDQHFTQPPPRYTEASLVKKLEELGIGRPSTYASILQVLQDRKYVKLEKKRFTPEDRGRVVTAFLASFFKRYVEYDFTADLEMQLDHISGGFIDWKTVLRDFWEDFYGQVDKTKDLKIRDVLDALDEDLGPHFFPPLEDGSDPRACPKCDDGRLGLKLGKFGAFIGCANYPDCKYTRKLAVNGNGEPEIDERTLGNDPETGLAVYVRQGPYGPYIQLGENGENGEKPKRASVPKGADAATIDLATACAVLSLPREVGPHPETGEMITAGLGRYGPFVRHESTYKKLESLEDVLTIGINRAVSLLKEAPKRKSRASGALRTLGDHPEDGKPVTVHSGRYGPYVKHGKINATIPDDMTPDDITIDQAVELLAARVERMAGGKGKKKTKAAGKTAAKRKTGTKRTSAASKSKSKTSSAA
ncbi:MAG: type I DNA topoisomerase [Alphaproteobacteria bacterium]|nr:type I DNA topoisomerase [Alphaproteobacteria bacterium]